MRELFSALSNLSTMVFAAASMVSAVGADLANIVNEAALLAVRRDGNQVQMSDPEETIGQTLQLPAQERYLMTFRAARRSDNGDVRGQATEELIYQELISTEATDDLQRASLIRQMVTRFGMTPRLGQLT